MYCFGSWSIGCIIFRVSKACVFETLRRYSFTFINNTYLFFPPQLAFCWVEQQELEGEVRRSKTWHDTLLLAGLFYYLQHLQSAQLHTGSFMLLTKLSWKLPRNKSSLNLSNQTALSKTLRHSSLKQRTLQSLSPWSWGVLAVPRQHWGPVAP